MKELIQRITALLYDKKKRKTRNKIGYAVACVVVFITTYALILPAITMEKHLSCGLPAHQHTDACYEYRLICGLEEYDGSSDEEFGDDVIVEDDSSDIDIIEDLDSGEGHIHTEDCYEKVLVCGLESHTHSADCYKKQASSAAENTVEEGDYIEENLSGDELVNEEGAAEDLTDESLSSDEEETGDMLTDSVEASAENGAQEEEYSEASLDEDEEQSVEEDAGPAEDASQPAGDAASADSGDVSEDQSSESATTIVYLEEDSEEDSFEDEQTGEAEQGAGEETGADSETGTPQEQASADDGQTGGSDQDAGAESGTGAPAAEGSADGAAADNKEGGNAVSEQGTEDGNSVQEPGAAGQEAQTEDPLQGSVSLADYLTGATAVYYSRTAETDGADEWKPVENDTVLKPSDKIRVYLAYQLPAGLLNSTNSQARYMLPEQLWLSDSRVDKINHFMNGMAAGTEDEAERASLLGAEAVEGSRRPDEEGSGKTEFISAIVSIENLQDAEGRFSGQDLVFRFVPYTVEKNSDVFDAEGAQTSKGQEVNGYFTIDYMVAEIMSGIAADGGASSDQAAEQAMEAVIVFASGNKESGQNEISAKLMISETAAEADPEEQDSKTAEADPGAEEGEGSQTDTESSEGGTAKTGTESAEAEKEDKDTNEKEGGEITADASEGSAAAAEAAGLSDQLQDMPAQKFEETIRVKTGGTGSGNAFSEFFKNVVGFFTGKGGADSDDPGKALSSEAELTVHVDADEGTFPAGTTMTVKAVSGRELNAVSEAISDTVDSETCGFQAVDITFRDAQGEEIEPKKPVRVTFSTDLINEAAQNDKIGQPVIVHVQDDGSAETLSSNAAAEGAARAAEERIAAGTGSTVGLEQGSVTFETGEAAESEQTGNDGIEGGTADPEQTKNDSQDGNSVEPGQTGGHTGSDVSDDSGKKRDIVEDSEPEDKEETQIKEDEDADGITVDTDSFSIYAIVYTVDFFWKVNGKTYEFSLPGGGFVPFETLMEILGVADGNPKVQAADADDAEADAEEAEAALMLTGIEASEKTKELVRDVVNVTFSSPELMWVGKAGEDTTVGALKEANSLEVQYSADLTEEQISQINAQTVKAGEWILISLQPFESEESLTVTMKNGDEFVVRVTDAQQIKKVVTTSGETLLVTVEVHNENDIARFEDLRVEEFAVGAEEYKEAYNAVFSSKEEEDENFDRDKCGFFAADIELLDKDGLAFEPEGRVYVKMELLRLPAEESVLTSTMEVQHLARQDGRIDVQTVASGESIYKIDDVITAKFSVESFSTFTLTWTDDGTGSEISDHDASTTLNIQNESGETFASVTVHYVDTDGNRIRSPFTVVNGTTPVTVDGLLNFEIQGYSYQDAHYQSNDGKIIKIITVNRDKDTTTGDVFVNLGTTSSNSGRNPGGQINNSPTQPSGYDVFFADAQGQTRIYFNNKRFRKTDDRNGAVYENGPVYGKTTGQVDNYQYTLSFDNTNIEPLENTNTTGTWDNAAEIYLVYENIDPNKSHATIHYGTLNADGSFSDLQETASLDTSAASISVNPTITGYAFLGAYYSSNPTDTPAVDTKQVDHILRKADDSWQYINVNDTTDRGFIENNSHIYVVYKEKTGSATPTPNDDSNIPKPSTVKKVTSNDDGTYDVQLDIIGQQIIESQRKGANVLLIFDRTSSMTSAMTGAPDPGRRIEAARAAVHTLVDTLDPANNPVQIAVYSFARFVDPVGGPNGYDKITGVDWTEDGKKITTFIDGLTLAPSGAATQYTYPGGTNWEAALDYAKVYLENPPDDDPTYIIFLTDGNPTIHNGTASTRGSGVINSSPNAQSTEYTAAVASADNLNTAYKFYGILCANASDGPLLQTLVTHLNGTGHDATHILADDSNKLTNSFQGIAEYIVNQLGAGEVSTNDGITSLSSVNASVSGAAGAFKYYKAYEVTFKDGKYTYIDDSGNEQEITDTTQVNTYNYQDSRGNPKTYLYYNRYVWDEAPGASYNEATGVTWDLGAEGTLQEGGIYSVRFTMWPSQEAYDLLADLNNGIKVYEAGKDNSITDNERNQVYKSGDIYYMKTNTNLDTSYSFGGTSYTDSIDYYQGAMDLDTRKISLEKLWPKNLLDSYVAGYSQSGIQDVITLNVTKDGQPYMDVPLTRNNNWKDDNVYISCGLLTVHNGIVEIKESGHDYTVTEPESFSYYWDLISDVYHPMVIGYDDGENGTKHEANLLILDEKLTEADNVNSFKINGKIYRKQEAGNVTLNARNYRRSNLNLTKRVIGANAPKDVLFEYTAKIKDAGGQAIWFSAMENGVYQVLETSSNVTPEYRTVEGAVYNSNDKTYTYTYNGQVYTLFAADDGTGKKMYTGFYSVPSDEEFTFKIKDGWNVRFINLLHDSTFSITESNMGEGFSFVNIGTEKLYPFTLVDPDTVWNNVEGRTITGTIVEPNNSYTVSYTNKWESVDFLLEKVKEDRVTKISGSEFDLEVKNDFGVWIELMEDIKPGGTKAVTDEGTGEVTTVDVDNPVNLGGLGIGVYRFNEINAPSGYIITAKYTYFEVYKENDVLKARLINEDGTPLKDDNNQEVTETAIAKLSSETVNGNTIYKITITNTHGAALPNTGGTGTGLFYLLGFMLTGLAGAGFVMLRRRIQRT